MPNSLDSIIVYHPGPPLADFVELFWLCRRSAMPHARERLLPMGAMELVMELDGDTPCPHVCGVHSQPFEIETVEPATIIGVHFKPGGAFPFLDLPADELHNAHVPLETLWGSKAGALRDRLLEAKATAAKFQAIQQALIDRARRRLAWHPAVATALKAIQSGSCPPAIADITDNIRLSPRRFIHLFRQQVGLTPKLFCRVQRFQAAVKKLAVMRRIEWSHLALACGYYDQSHFVNEFREFSGLCPTAYLQVRGDHLNHVPLVD
jgi:methylphosphotriester-DNA--protein-cysteine methyltransferase